MDKLTEKQLNSKRSAFKAHFASFTKYLDSLEGEIDESIVDTLVSKLDRLNLKTKEFEEVQSLIEQKADDIDEQLEIKLDIEDRIDLCTGKAKSFINSIRNKSPHMSDSSSISNNSSINHVKLPTIEFPTFDGHCTKWKSFEDNFVAIIHNNNSLSNVQKLCYLRSALKNYALNVIQALETTEANYEIALELIRNRHNNKRRIIYSHANAILNLKFVNLKSLCNAIEQHLQSLWSFNQPVDKWQALLVPIILSKLDLKICRDWEGYINNLMSKQELPDHKKTN